MKPANLIGLALLAAAFVAASVQMVRQHRAEHDPAVRTLRIGHWLIHAGMPEAFAAVIADYEARHPGVRVEQNAVPLKTWYAWQRAQWSGDGTPDLMQLGKGSGLAEVGRYYTPLSRWLDEPNPYNAGTPLEGIPWRRTFVDGLNNLSSYYPALGDTFGIPSQVTTFRLYYNRDLLRELTGGDQPPQTIDAFLALGKQAAEHGRRTGRALVPLSVCGPYGEALFDLLGSGMTPHLLERTARSRTLLPDSMELAQRYLAGDWSLAGPEVRRALELWSELFGLCAPGFLTQQREDAHFTFVTGRALFLYAGSWDYAGVTQEARFPMGVTVFPLPQAGQGHWGEYSLGPLSEATWMEAVLGISRSSPHPELALDFLRFLTSYEEASKFTRISRRLSAIVDVPVAEELVALSPRWEGSFAGMPLRLSGLPGGNALLRFQQNLHLLGAAGDRGAAVDRFVRTVETTWPDNLRRDLARARATLANNRRLADSRLIFAVTKGASDEELSLILESSLDQALSAAQLRDPAGGQP